MLTHCRRSSAHWRGISTRTLRTPKCWMPFLTQCQRNLFLLLGSIQGVSFVRGICKTLSFQMKLFHNFLHDNTILSYWANTERIRAFPLFQQHIFTCTSCDCKQRCFQHLQWKRKLIDQPWMHVLQCPHSNPLRTHTQPHHCQAHTTIRPKLNSA